MFLITLEQITPRKRTNLRKLSNQVSKARLLEALLRYRYLSLIRRNRKKFNRIYMLYEIHNWIKFKDVMKNQSFNLKRVSGRPYRNSMRLIRWKIRTPGFQKEVSTLITFFLGFHKGWWMEFMAQKKSQRKNIEQESRQELEYRWAIRIRIQIS